MNRLLNIILAALLGAAAFTPVATAAVDRIELRRSIRRPAADRPVLLEDVARLEGEHALRLGRLVVLPALSGNAARRAVSFTIDDLRRLLEDSDVRWAAMELHGGRVVVRPASLPRSAVSDGEEADTDSVVPVGSAPLPAAGLRSVRDWTQGRDSGIGRRIAALVAEAMKDVEANPDRLLFSFDATAMSRLHPEIEGIGVTVLAASRDEPAGIKDDLVLKVGGTRPNGSRQAVHVRVEIRVLRAMPVATRPIRRGRRIVGDGHDMSLQFRPVRISEVMEGAETMAGRKVIEDIPLGATIVPGLLESESIVKRGAFVMLRSIFDGHEINLEVECMKDACLHDVVPFETPDGARVMGRVLGSNIAEIQPSS
ncbi:MAG: flagella basal body P-ring formation protein FlgA [Phycisphaera sp.]|nr:flagella basal body P-ring formation protein FlgA [Phycisphaera sp.]